jgi:hypothetical protein
MPDRLPYAAMPMAISTTARAATAATMIVGSTTASSSGSDG